MKKLFLILLIFILGKIHAQTGIGTTTPHVSAKLDVSATNKGFLPPRVTLTSATDASTISSPAEGLLVYNLGSVGLQAGYYYWNGANWATIATGTNAGNAVVASNLVKLYHESYATTSGKAPSSDGFSFTVPASGRYEFNFNSTGWNSNGSTIKLTYNIRQGTTVLGTDYHQSSSSNVWAEYEGRVEANLTAGVTYNAQVVTSIGNRDYRDWDKIMYKMIAGNLPVNQHIADRNIQLNNNYISNDGDNEGIRIDNSGNVGVGTSTPTAKLNISGGGVKINSGLSNASTRPSLNASTVGNYEIRGVGGGTTQNDTQDDGFLRLSAGGGTNSNTQSSIDLSGYSTIGDMNRTIIMRTSGVERLRIDANGSLNVPDVNGNASTIATKVGGFVNAGTFVQMDNIKATVTTSGNRGLSVAAVSTPFYCNIGASFANVNGGSGGNAVYNTYVTTTPSGSWFGWGFGNAGDVAVYTVTDTTNNRMYRITMQIGAGYSNNSIVIERLL